MRSALYRFDPGVFERRSAYAAERRLAPSVKVVMTVASNASPRAPRPTATPMAAVIQIPAAVVSPWISRSDASLRMASPPMNPMPVVKPWTTREMPSDDMPLPSQATTNNAEPREIGHLVPFALTKKLPRNFTFAGRHVSESRLQQMEHALVLGGSETATECSLFPRRSEFPGSTRTLRAAPPRKSVGQAGPKRSELAFRMSLRASSDGRKLKSIRFRHATPMIRKPGKKSTTALRTMVPHRSAVSVAAPKKALRSVMPVADTWLTPQQILLVEAEVRRAHPEKLKLAGTPLMKSLGL